MSNVKVKVVNNSPNPLPEYQTSGSVGMDVRAWCHGDAFVGHGADWDEESQAIIIFSGGRACIPTGLQVQIPDGYEIQLRPRSGMSIKQGAMAVLGTIDSDFRGSIGIIVYNFSDEPLYVKTGDRLGQLVLNKIDTIEFEEVDELDQTERGNGGFGHTGVN